jgi:hypothetical protein
MSVIAYPIWLAATAPTFVCFSMKTSTQINAFWHRRKSRRLGKMTVIVIRNKNKSVNLILAIAQDRL